MPVIIKPSAHGANALDSSQLGSVANAKDLLWGALPGDIPPDIDLYQSTWGHGSAKLDRPVVPSTNGFVRSLIKAYGQHHHLTLRPDDIWFAILTQFSLYVNAHSEELRGKFVAHAGREELRIEYSPFSRHDFDFALFARDMARLLGTVVVDDELRRWVTPAFSTTTANDEVVASVVMMGTLQKYFEFTCGIICGFPSVTLLGEKADYDALLQKVDKLDEYGEEPRHFAAMLRPVLRRFVRSFEDPTADDVRQFWRTAFDVDDMLCGVTWYTGWITAFCYWDEVSLFLDSSAVQGNDMLTVSRMARACIATARAQAVTCRCERTQRRSGTSSWTDRDITASMKKTCLRLGARCLLTSSRPRGT